MSWHLDSPSASFTHLKPPLPLAGQEPEHMPDALALLGGSRHGTGRIGPDTNPGVTASLTELIGKHFGVKPGRIFIQVRRRGTDRAAVRSKCGPYVCARPAEREEVVDEQVRDGGWCRRGCVWCGQFVDSAASNFGWNGRTFG